MDYLGTLAQTVRTGGEADVMAYVSMHQQKLYTAFPTLLEGIIELLEDKRSEAILVTKESNIAIKKSKGLVYAKDNTPDAKGVEVGNIPKEQNTQSLARVLWPKIVVKVAIQRYAAPQKSKESTSTSKQRKK